MLRSFALLLFLCATLAQAGPFTPPIDALEREIGERTQRVEEFRFLRREAEKLGVRVYLFGGTAAAYSHYVKWDLERQAGDQRYQPNRFDYDYTNIYRSTQDLDIVVDGNPEQAKALQDALAKKFPHLQGSKSAWEVRLLRQDLGDKQALLNNADFLNQHSDSNSTGLVEVTRTPAGEEPVRDLFDWESKQPHFLRDVHEGKLHYYFSPKHGSTAFAKEGRNPPILSAIRYLTKAFQFELELRPEDLAKVREIVDHFHPQGKEVQNEYVQNWLLKKDNGRKLLQNAVNLEYAAHVLDDLGLREKLRRIKNDQEVQGSLAWWMNKKPLPSRAVGKGFGTTARDLGLDVVAHETTGFLAYESITKAHTGDPNVFTSREHAAGEAAAFGEGFYTRRGEVGARGTGFTIRFKVKPDARLGSDFEIPKDHPDFVIMKNRNAFTVIPESLNWTRLDYYRWLASGNTLSRDDKGIFEKLKRRLAAKPITAEERAAMHEIVRQTLASEAPSQPLVDQWLTEALSPAEKAEVARAAIAKPTLWRTNYPGSDFTRYVEFVRSLGDDFLRSSGGDALAREITESLGRPDPNLLLAATWATVDPVEKRAGDVAVALASHSFAGVEPHKLLGLQQELFASYFEQNIHNGNIRRVAGALLAHQPARSAVNAFGSLFNDKTRRAELEPLLPKLLSGLIAEGELTHFIFRELHEHPALYSPELVSTYLRATTEKRFDRPTEVEKVIFSRGLYADLPARKERLRQLMGRELDSLLRRELSTEIVAPWCRDYPADHEFDAALDQWVRRTAEPILARPSSENYTTDGFRKFLQALPDRVPEEIEIAFIDRHYNKNLGFLQLDILFHWLDQAKSPAGLSAAKRASAERYARYLLHGFPDTAMTGLLSNLMDLLPPSTHPDLWAEFQRKVNAELDETPNTSNQRYGYFDAWLKSKEGQRNPAPVDKLLADGKYRLLFRQLGINRENGHWMSHPATLRAFRKVTAEPYGEPVSGEGSVLRDIYEQNRLAWTSAENERFYDWLIEQAHFEKRLHETYLLFTDELAQRSPRVMERMSRYLDVDFTYAKGLNNPALKLAQDFKYHPRLSRAAGRDQVMDKIITYARKRLPFEDLLATAPTIEEVLALPAWRDDPRTPLWRKVLKGEEPVSALRPEETGFARCASFFRDLLH